MLLSNVRSGPCVFVFHDKKGIGIAEKSHYYSQTIYTNQSLVITTTHYRTHLHRHLHSQQVRKALLQFSDTCAHAHAVMRPITGAECIHKSAVAARNAHASNSSFARVCLLAFFRSFLDATGVMPHFKTLLTQLFCHSEMTFFG